MRRLTVRSLTIAALAGILGVLALPPPLGATGARESVAIPVRSIEFRIRADVHPHAQPKRARVPVQLTVAGELTGQKGVGPALEELRLDMDRDLAFDLDQLPPCVSPSLDRAHSRIGGRGASDEARAKCRSSIAARGEAKFLLAYPEKSPIPVVSDLTLFMGSTRDGIATLFLHAYITVPTPTAVIGAVELKKVRDGRHGTRATIAMPKIANGYGRLTSFNLTIPRWSTHEGERLSLVQLRCADGRLQIEGTSTFADGLMSTSTAVRPCKAIPD